MATPTDYPLPAEQAIAQRRALVAHARELREATEAMGAVAEQTRRQARSLADQANAILDTTVALIEAVLARRGLTLAEPVAARFRTDERGSTGIEVIVRLSDPARAAVARHAITERFGGEGRSDNLIIA